MSNKKQPFNPTKWDFNIKNYHELTTNESIQYAINTLHLEEQINFIYNLPEEKKNALFEYMTENNKNIYKNINAELRTNTVKRGLYETPETTNIIRLIDSVFEEIPPITTYIEVFRCYRDGIIENNFNEHVSKDDLDNDDNLDIYTDEQLKQVFLNRVIDDEIRMINVNQYLSTTLYHNFAIKICRDNVSNQPLTSNSFIIKITIPTNTKIIPLFMFNFTDSENEYEILLPRNGKLYRTNPINNERNNTGLTQQQYIQYMKTHINSFIFIEKKYNKIGDNLLSSLFSKKNKNGGKRNKKNKKRNKTKKNKNKKY
jgi:hypothetical protein